MKNPFVIAFASALITAGALMWAATFTLVGYVFVDPGERPLAAPDLAHGPAAPGHADLRRDQPAPGRAPGLSARWRPNRHDGARLGRIGP